MIVVGLWAMPDDDDNDDDKVNDHLGDIDE